MKILCNCGAKFAVDVTPDMASRPVQFVCPSCGLDSSEAVNQLIRQELAAAASAAPAPAPAPVPAVQATATATATATAVVESHPKPGTRIHVATPAAPTMAAAGGAAAGQNCAKHPGQEIAHKCLVCGKPMCPKCMELFGYVCSPFCRSRAEARKMAIPVYAGQKSVSEARLWRKVGMVVASVCTVLGLLLGAWVYYEWFLSRPKTHFAVQFPDGIFTGQTEFCSRDQMIFLHGVTLSRYDLKAKKEVWSRELVSAERVKAFREEAHRMASEWNTAARERGGYVPRFPTDEELHETAINMAAATFGVHVQNSNVWLAVENSGKVVMLDWETGKDGKEIPIGGGPALITRDNDKLTARTMNELTQRVITHVDLKSGESRVETLGEPVQPKAVAIARPGRAPAKKPAVSPPATIGLPTVATAANARTPMDPAKVAADVQNLSGPAKIALPATVANTLNQQRILRALEDDDDSREAAARKAFGTAVAPDDSVDYIASRHGNFGFAVRLIERRLVERVAMKDPPKKSALDGNVNVTQSMEIANELLNEMQRNAGGDKVVEDESRFLVTVHSMDAKTPDWSGEVIGKPQLFPLKTVTVVAGGAMIVVLDKSNKKLWEAKFTHKIPNAWSFDDEEDSKSGQFPCAERDSRVYVCDQAMLTAFDANTGAVAWRLPSVGIAGLLFDEAGNVYVNTTTAGLDSVKYSRQIDVTKAVSAVILKVDGKTGKALWTSQAGGFISYLSGKYIYVASWNDADDLKDSPFATGMETPSYVRVKRIDPDDGRIRWDYHKTRAPLAVHFDENQIQIVYKKEMEVLRYVSF